MLPTVIYEDFIRPFSFYRSGLIHQGMSHSHKLYQLVGTFSAVERTQAYVVGCNLGSQGNLVVITVSNYAYKVWVDLSSMTGQTE